MQIQKPFHCIINWQSESLRKCDYFSCIKHDNSILNKRVESTLQQQSLRISQKLSTVVPFEYLPLSCLKLLMQWVLRAFLQRVKGQLTEKGKSLNLECSGSDSLLKYLQFEQKYWFY